MMLNINCIRDLFLLEPEWEYEFNKIAKGKNQVVLVGAGSTSEFIAQTFIDHEIVPVCFTDNNILKHGTTINISNRKIDIISTTRAIELYPNAIFYITTQLFYTPLKEQLLSLGVFESRICEYDLICQFPWEHNYKDFIVSHEAKWQSILDMLSDSLSKETLLSRLAFLITRRRSYATEIKK